MPELPDITIYVERLHALATGKVLERVRLASPFLLRSVTPSLSDVAGRRIEGFHAIGKRIVWELEGELFLVLHLMIAGRLKAFEKGKAIPKKLGLAAFELDDCAFLLTEAGTKKRASLHVVGSRQALADHDPGGVEVSTMDSASFAARLTAKNHTLKRALTDPRIFSGIGNAYSDEILHRARLSPVRWTTRLNGDEIERLRLAILATMAEWVERLREQTGDGFPVKVTAFRSEMATHGKYGKPCPVCGDPVQRIRYASKETNYCPTCQTGGKLLADRGLSRLLKGDWPKSLESLESLKAERKSD